MTKVFIIMQYKNCNYAFFNLGKLQEFCNKSEVKFGISKKMSYILVLRNQKKLITTSLQALHRGPKKLCL